MKSPRIVSLLPAATEMVYALGLGDQLVGVSHECDFPAAARRLPAVVRPALDLDALSLREMDLAVAARLGRGQSLYEVDEARLRELAPDLILTQNLCQVCAPSGNELSVALRQLPHPPEILWLSPHTLAGIFQNLRDLGLATGRLPAAEIVIAERHACLEQITARTRHINRRPRVSCLEWADPLYCAGHWVPEMIETAGGFDALARRGKNSARLAWADIRQWAPEILILSPCGFRTAKALAQIPLLAELPGWAELPAVRAGNVFCADANAYFARPGPRVVEGVQLLAHLIHPDLFDWPGPADAFSRVPPLPLPLSMAATSEGKP